MARKKGSKALAGPTHRSVEIGVAITMIVFALIVIVGSRQVGSGWSSDGPRPGFFPFYVGITILGASIYNLIQAWNISGDRLYAEWSQLRQVLFVVIPTAIYVSLLPWIGIYVTSAVLIAFFMRGLGNYSWAKIAAVSILVPLATFLVFERWFLVPLPKGPLEAALGF